MTSDPDRPALAQKIPQHLLNNCRVLASREELFKYFPKDMVFCEICVALGEFSANVLTACSVRKFYALDLFFLHHVPDM